MKKVQKLSVQNACMQCEVRVFCGYRFMGASFHLILCFLHKWELGYRVMMMMMTMMTMVM